MIVPRHVNVEQNPRVLRVGSGCRTDFIPQEGEDVPDGNWYPVGDSFVPAPTGYRVKEGVCTRCGNIYEPACPGPKGDPLCLTDMHGNIQMVPTEVCRSTLQARSLS